jgi:hypothetical protein
MNKEQKILPLRKCLDCGIEAHTQKEMETLFVRHTPYRNPSKYGYRNRCKKCHAQRVRQNKQPRPTPNWYHFLRKIEA